MKAITRDTYGSADVLRLRDVEEPTPGEREVLVEVRAAGIARGVLHVMTGEPDLMRLVGFGLLRPKTPSGARTSPGPGRRRDHHRHWRRCHRFTVGDEVFGVQGKTRRNALSTR
jgi:hypothetical protein